MQSKDSNAFYFVMASWYVWVSVTFHAGLHGRPYGHLTALGTKGWTPDSHAWYIADEVFPLPKVAWHFI